MQRSFFFNPALLTFAERLFLWTHGKLSKYSEIYMIETSQCKSRIDFSLESTFNMYAALLTDHCTNKP